MTTANKLQITLTDRAPVTIATAEWPRIAHGSDWSGGQVECQANEVWWIRVRQHADGRAIVYADRDSGPGGKPIGYRGVSGGELVPAGGDIAAAVLRVGENVGIPAHTIAECVANLPAEEL